MAYIIFPFAGALIGWVTNIIAIRLLFRPLEPVRLPPFKVAFQGLIPKRREQIALKVGQVVEEQLFSLGELAVRLDMAELQKEVSAQSSVVVERLCNEKLCLLPGSLRRHCSNYLRELIAAAVAENFPHMADILLERAQQQVDIRQVVAEKINSLDMIEVEELVIEVARHELKQIEWLGALLGFLIGLLQSLLFYLLVRT